MSVLRKGSQPIYMAVSVTPGEKNWTALWQNGKKTWKKNGMILSNTVFLLLNPYYLHKVVWTYTKVF